LHYATILKHLCDVYCLKYKEVFSVNLKTDMALEDSNYINILFFIFIFLI